MAVSNIEKFDALTGKILGALYLEFPIPVALRLEDFVEHPAQACAPQAASKEAEFFIATVQWLCNTGYLNGALKPGSGIENAVLSAKGLEVLKHVPASLSTRASLGEHLADATKSGSEEVAKGVMAELLSVGAKMFSPALGLVL
ncbi:hypothetical protein D3C76_201230 [compost metagenome]